MPASRKPNIILVMTDQQRFDQVGYASPHAPRILMPAEMGGQVPFALKTARKSVIVVYWLRQGHAQ